MKTDQVRLKELVSSLRAAFDLGIRRPDAFVALRARFEMLPL